MRRSRWAAVLLLLALIAIGALMAGSHFLAGHHRTAARRAVAARDYDRARHHLDTLQWLRPRDAEAPFLLGRLSRQSSHYPETERALETAQRLGYDRDAVSLERALLRAQQGDLDRLAEQYLRRLVDDRHPDLCLILEALSRGYSQNYRLKDAQDALDIWIGQAPDDLQAYMGRAWVHERLDHYPEAIADYQKAHELAPELLEPAIRLAQIHLQLGNGQEAAPLFAQVREQEPRNPIARLGLAQAWAKLGRSEEALALLDELATEKPGDGAVLLERGNLAAQLGRAEEGEAWLRRAAQAAPHDYQANYHLLQCLRQLGKVEEARVQEAKLTGIQTDLLRMRDLTDQLQRRPFDAGLRCEIAQLFLRNGEKREGLLWLRGALRADPRHPETHRALAAYYEENGEPDLAARHRRQAEGAVSAPRPPG